MCQSVGKIFSRRLIEIFFLFVQENRFDISCNLSPMKTKCIKYQIQSTLVISNSKGPSEILRDIRTSTYPICKIEEKIIRTITFNKYICNWTL